MTNHKAIPMAARKAGSGAAGSIVRLRQLAPVDRVVTHVIVVSVAAWLRNLLG
jgi:hypothetical protein